MSLQKAAKPVGVGLRISDKSRYEHSVGVAYLISQIAKKLRFRQINRTYAICWGLLHDIATWPLSHTGEAAFSVTTQMSAKKLRKIMILGSRILPEKYSVRKQLEEIGVSNEVLFTLFDKKNKTTANPELGMLWDIIHSPLTPDTLDGIWRAGKDIGMHEIPKPDQLIDSFGRDLCDDIVIKHEKLGLIKQFWNKKSELYENYINDESIVRYESECSMMLRNKFKNLSLVESLEIKEKELVDYIKSVFYGIDITIRYKKPLKYTFRSPKAGKQRGDIWIRQLKDYLVSERKRNICI